MRAGKQCRERWHNHLRPDIKRGPWTEEEERLLIAAHESLGNRWADIAANIPGRTENAVKNHWNATNRRRDVPVRQNGSSLVLREYLLRKALGDDDAVVVTDAPADLTRHIQTNALGTTKTDVMWQARRDGREVAATRPSLSLHRPFPVAPETFYRFKLEHEDDDDEGRTLGSSPWFNPRGTLADDSYGDNHGAIDPLAGRHGVAERVAKVSSDARRAYEENELRSQLPRSTPSAPSFQPKIIPATTGKNGVKRKTRPLHRAPDAADDELMAVVMKKVRQTKGKIWLTEDALGENPRESNARLAPTYKAAKQPLRPPHHPHHSSAARRPSADSCDTFLDPIEPYGSHRGSLSFGFGSEEDDDHDAIMNQCAAAAAAAHDHHDSFYGGNKPVNGDGDMTNGHTRDTFVDAVVAAVSIETERGRSIHSVPSTGTLQDRAEANAEAEAEQHRAAARGGIASARPRLSVTRRVKTFAAAEDVVEIVGGNDCVSAERCVDLARYEEESVGEDNIGDDEEIEVATYASARPIHRDIADALGAELRTEGVSSPRGGGGGSGASSDDDFIKEEIKEETAGDDIEGLAPVSERLAEALSRAVRSANPGVTRVVLSVKAGGFNGSPAHSGDSGNSSGNSGSTTRRGSMASENAYAVAVSASSWKIAVDGVGAAAEFLKRCASEGEAAIRPRASSLVLSG